MTAMMMIENAMKARRGMVTKPKYSTYLVVQDTPVLHGARVSGMNL